MVFVIVRPFKEDDKRKSGYMAVHRLVGASSKEVIGAHNIIT